MEEPQGTIVKFLSSIHFFRKYFSTNNRTHVLQEKQFSLSTVFLLLERSDTAFQKDLSAFIFLDTMTLEDEGMIALCHVGNHKPSDTT
jgi:hypothetical protein